MPKINVLPKSVAELIAAGEVVERPLSVVKELVENSIDAGADQITVEIRSGGVKYIRVTDNGCGIERADVRTAFISHATSKIRSADDLAGIFTLGFRGEALPSIAAVSRMTVLTKTAEEDEGTCFEIEGGAETSLESAGCPVGTTVVVRDLFYNTPARMKFLKRDVTEGNYIADIVTKTALSHPEIRFTLIRDEKRSLSTPGSGGLLAAVFALFGKDVSEALLPCAYAHEGISVEGFVSRPLNNRPNRNMQYFFVNGRCVRIPAAAPALDNAYKNSIMVGKFPMCFLNIAVDVTKTDVNVHPSKTEIRFAEDRKIYEAVYFAARAALSAGDRKRPEVRLKSDAEVLRAKTPEVTQMKLRDIPAFQPEKKSAFPASTAATEKKPTAAGTAARFPEPERLPRRPEIDIVCDDPQEKADDSRLRFRDGTVLAAGESAVAASAKSGAGYDPFKSRTAGPAAPTEPEAPPPTEADVPAQQRVFDFSAAEKTAQTPADDTPVYVLGEAFRTYIIAEYGNKLLLIDKHAAHERLIYNELIRARTAPDSQQLLAPVSVTLSGREFAAVTENAAVFEKAGFEVEPFGGSTVLVRACPVQLTREDASALVAEIAGELARGNNAPEPEKLTWLYESAACRAAVKAGDDLKPEEMQHFAERLLKDSELRYCPHGRPVMYELTKYEIEKQFGRVT